METKKKIYEAPDISVTQVEVESSICSGSVQFGDPEKKEGVSISDQSVANVGEDGKLLTNDFSGQEWTVN